MNIHGENVILRAPELKDLNLLNLWSNDPSIWSLLAGWHFPFSELSTENWIKNRNDNSLENQVFCIDTPNDGLIGTINLVDIDWKNRNATTGMMIGSEKNRGKGYALDALISLMKYSFLELGLNRQMLIWFPITNGQYIFILKKQAGQKREEKEIGFLGKVGFMTK